MKATNLNKTPYSKRDFVDKLRAEKGMSVREASEIYDIFITDMYKALLDDRKIILYRIGSIRAMDRKPYSGRNPKTGESVKVAARKTLVLRPSEIIKRDLLEEGEVVQSAKAKKAKKATSKLKKA
ncbi:HU family DNA-binding protein [Lactiplantibacillus plantarum]|uniref:HU family DNA-binding protein n=1 Tax=Lactiplantibacillus plantarum TaxID=1590 RepID=UPI001BA7D38E|nr:HU family DNA-binding protein [Lactiplantibacillus plantarum]MBS0936357.1 HU family DNA-binding protein [Lactiplantibacillus plantarum]MBS0943786.1 HU family DNA-binding protein [Lactiplantibacillus plantarum]